MENHLMRKNGREISQKEVIKLNSIVTVIFFWPNRNFCNCDIHKRIH